MGKKGNNFAKKQEMRWLANKGVSTDSPADTQQSYLIGGLILLVIIIVVNNLMRL